MTRGAASDQDHAVAWARDHGINLFDTAPSYGDGVSESNLGRALQGRVDGLVIGTKVGLREADMADISAAVRRSVEASLKRLKLDHVDLIQLHNTIDTPGHWARITDDQVLSDVIPAFQALRDAGKVRFFGFTADGDTAQMHRMIRSGVFHSAQIFFNLLVPSAGDVVPPGYPAQDYRQILGLAHDHGLGSIGVRVLAGGALSGTESRHPLGMARVAPIGSNTDYETDVCHARRFQPLVDDGYAADLPELAIRYTISNPHLTTIEVGMATLEQLQQAARAVDKGPLPGAALARIRAIQAGLAESP